nr:hypothetical protein SYMBAF_130002 [Serratia symbiotica]
MGPLAKLQLGFTLLTGGRGITGTIAALRTLGTASGRQWQACADGCQFSAR